MSEKQSLFQNNLQPIEKITFWYDAKAGLFLCLQYIKHVDLYHQT